MAETTHVMVSTWRALRVIEHLTTGAMIALYISLTSRQDRRPAWLPSVVRWWCERLYHALGVRLRTTGRFVPNSLLVGNHISWLDIPILGANGEIGFLSKSDVRRWPLIGWMADVAGTRFIERGGHQSEAVHSQLLEDLSRGQSRLIFPEGTTTDGHKVGRFHPRLFAIAQQAPIHVQPVAISYRGTERLGPDPSVPYVGADSLMSNLWRLIRHPGLVASVHFLPPMRAATGESRRALADRARAAIVEALKVEFQSVDDCSAPDRHQSREASQCAWP